MSDVLPVAERRRKIEAKVRVEDKKVPIVFGQFVTIVVFSVGLGLTAWGLISAFMTLGQLFAGLTPEGGWLHGWLGIAAMLVGGIIMGTARYQQPNEARVISLFGNYLGTVTTTGLFMVPIPFTSSDKVFLAQNNFESDKLKINDAKGNPLSVSSVVVYRVSKPAQAIFSVNDYQKYLAIQAEGALRHAVSRYPYSSTDPETPSLLASLDAVNQELLAELSEAAEMAGVEIVDARINNLSYSVEIAQAMLQRQQAEAIVDAREVIVKGAVEIVDEAVASLESKGVKLDKAEKSRLVTNLLTVLVGDHSATPTIPLD